MKKRPILIVTIGYLIGIVWGLYCKCNIALLYIMLFIVCLLFEKVKVKRHKFKLISFSRYIKYTKILMNYNTIIILVLFSLLSNIAVLKSNNKYNNLYKNVEEISCIARVIDNGKVKDKNIVYTVKIERLNQEDKYKNTKLLITVAKENKLEYGDKIYIKGKFKEPEVQKNYRGFDYKEYLKTRKIYGTVKVEEIKIIKKNTNNFLFTYANSLFLKIKDNIEKTYSEEKENLILGIILGDTENISEDIKEDFKNSGISHVLAVSGMHIMYITCGISVLLVGKIGKRSTRIITIIILIMYMFITNFSPSIVRARSDGSNNIIGFHSI